MIDHGRQAPTLEAYQVHVGSMRASSRGWLKLASKDPRQHPLIDPNYLDSEQDRWALGGRGTYVVFVCLYNGKLRRETVHFGKMRLRLSFRQQNILKIFAK